MDRHVPELPPITAAKVDDGSIGAEASPADTGQGGGTTAGQGGPNLSPGSIRPVPRFDAGSWRQAQAHALGAPGTGFGDDASAAARPALAAFARPASGSARLGTAQPAPQRGLLAVWAGLGTVSVLYLGIVAWQQTHGAESVLAPVTESVEHLAADIADLRHVAAELDARERATASRVGVAESRIDGLSQAVAGLTQGDVVSDATQGQRPTNRAVLASSQNPAGNGRNAAASLDASARNPAAVAHAAPGGMPVSGPAVAGADGAVGTSAAGTSTAASVAKPIVAAAKPKSAPAPTTTAAAPAGSNPIKTGSVATGVHPGLLVASGPSLDSIRLSWSVLRQNHASVLGGLEPRFVPTGDGSAFNLIAGPFANAAAAQKACGALKEHGVGCKAADYAGAAL